MSQWKNQSSLRLVSIDGHLLDARKCDQSTSDLSSSHVTSPADSLSIAIANASPQRRKPYETFLRWPTVVPHLLANVPRSESVIGFRKDLRSMSDYHRTVIEIATPSMEFTEWWWLSDNESVEIDQAKIRRDNLRRLIDKRFRENISALARAYAPESPRPNYFSELLNEKSGKSFGEKVARRIEIAVGLRRGQLDIPDSQLLLDPNASSRLTYELHSVVEDLDEEEQAEALAAIQRLRQRRSRRAR